MIETERLIDLSAVLFDSGRVGWRQRIAVQVTVRTPDGQSRTLLSDDVSPAGVFVHTSTPNPPGTRARLEFALPKLPMMHIDAVVAWNTDATSEGQTNVPRRGMGLRFTYVPPVAAAAIARWFEPPQRPGLRPMKR